MKSVHCGPSFASVRLLSFEDATHPSHVRFSSQRSSCESSSLTHRANAMSLSLRTLCFLLLGAVALAGCSPQPDASDSASPQRESNATSPQPSGKPRIALVMKSLANEFFSTMAAGAVAHQAAHAEQYELIVNGIKDERDLARQASLVEEMVAAGAKAIVIAPADSKALIPALRRAQKAGVVVINIDNKLDTEVLQQESVSIPFVGPNNRMGAKRVGDFLAKNLQAGDQVAVLEGIRSSFNGTQRRLGFEDAMQAASIKIVDSQSAQWEVNQANTIAASMLNAHADLKAILAANDSMALGAMAAIKAANKVEQVRVVGFDHISAARQAILEGRMLATADQHGDQLAVYGIEVALQMLSDPKLIVADRETPVDLITRAEIELESNPSP